VLAWYTSAEREGEATGAALASCHALSRVESAPRDLLVAAAHAALRSLRACTRLCDAFCDEQPPLGSGDAADAAARLRLLARLLPLLPPSALWPRHALQPRDAAEPWPAGGVHQLLGPPCALLAASAAGGALLRVDAAPLAGAPAWSGEAAVASANILLAQLTASWQQCGAGAEDAPQRMMACALACMAPELRAALLPAEDGLMGDRAAATAAAQSLRASLARLTHPACGTVLAAALPPLLLALEAPLPAARAHAQLAALHAAASVTRTQLRHVSGPLLQAMLAGLCCGREPAAAWPLVVRCSSAVVLRLGSQEHASGPLVRRGGAYQLLCALFAETQLRSGDAAAAEPVLRALPALCRSQGLSMLLHWRVAQPLLCAWAAQGGQRRCQALAAEALTAAMESLWPRAEAHASTLWPALLQGFAAASQQRGGAAEEERGRSAAALMRLARQLHYAGGAAFRALWRDSERSAGDAEQPLFDMLRQLAAAEEPANGAAAEGQTEALPASEEEPFPSLEEQSADDNDVAALEAWAAGDSEALPRLG